MATLNSTAFTVIIDRSTTTPTVGDEDQVKTGEMMGEENEEIEITEDYTLLEDTTVIVDDDSDIQENVLYNEAMEYKEEIDNVKEELRNKILAILEAGEIKSEDNDELTLLQEKYTENYTALKTLSVEKGTNTDSNEFIFDNRITSDNLIETLLQTDILSVIADKISLTADNIDLNGYVSNNSDDPNWSITTDGNIEAKNLSVEGELSTDILNVNTINNPKYPATLDGDIKLYVSTLTGNDDYTLDEVLASIDESESEGSADLIKKFYSLRGVHNALPKNLNGKTVRIYCETDDNGQVLFSNFTSGRILIFLCSHEIKGYIGDYNCYADFKIYGGSDQNEPSTYGVIRPSTNTVYSSDNSSVFMQKSPVCGIYYCNIYGGSSESGYSAIKVTEDCKCRIELCNFYSAYTFVNVSSISEVFVNKTTGLATDYAFKSYTGSTIHLANTTQANGKNGNAYWNNASVIFGSLSQTIVGNYNITWDSSTTVTENNTTTSATTTSTATYKSTLGDTYRTTYSSWKKDSTVRQGNGWGSGNCTGLWFFGTQFAELKGKTIKKVTITIKRQDNNGYNTAVTHKLWMHNYSTRPSGAPTLNSAWNTTFTLERNQTKTITITDSTVLNAISAGTCKGFGIRHTYSDTYYSVCSGSTTVKITYEEE